MLTQDEALTILRDGILLVAKLSAPILLLSMLVGILISIFQAATQINEQTITFVPKLALVFLVLIVAGSWMINSLADFATTLFGMMV